MSFMIFSMPRSRSYWMSQYLSYPPHTVGHDVILKADNLTGLIREYSALSGSVELSAVLGWQYFMSFFPETRVVTVRRPVDDVFKSLLNVGLYTPIPILEMRERALIACSQHPRVEAITYKDLDNPDCCRWLFEYCLNMKWDEEWYKHLASQNLQCEVLQKAMLNNKRLHIMEKILLEAAAVTPEIMKQAQYVS
jgi:hypothetical protein